MEIEKVIINGWAIQQIAGGNSFAAVKISASKWATYSHIDDFWADGDAICQINSNEVSGWLTRAEYSRIDAIEFEEIRQASIAADSQAVLMAYWQELSTPKIAQARLF